MAETPILSWSATYLPPSRGLSGSGGLLLASYSQLFRVILDPLGSMGLECGRGAGLTDLPLTVSSETELMEKDIR